jgi:hypothetical protein
MTGVAQVADVDVVRWVNGRMRQRGMTLGPKRSLHATTGKGMHAEWLLQVAQRIVVVPRH